MNSENRKVGWMFIVWWIGLTLIGGFVGRYVTDLLFAGSGWIVFSTGVIGLAVSSTQWILLRRYFPKSIWWLVTGTAGLVFGAIVGNIVLQRMIDSLNVKDAVWLSLTYAIILGTVLGTYQWAFLKHFHTKAGWWILGNGIGEMFGSIIVIFFLATTPNNFTTPILLDALRGIITGTLMLWILHQPIPEQSEKGRLDTKRLDIGLWLLLGIAFVMAISKGYSGFKELYLLGGSLIGTLVGAWLGKMRGAIYGLAIGIIGGYLIWFIGTCQFCQ